MSEVKFVRTAGEYSTLVEGQFVLYPNTGIYFNDKTPWSCALVQDFARRATGTRESHCVMLEECNSRFQGLGRDTRFIAFGSDPLYVIPEEVLRGKYDKSKLGQELLVVSDTDGIVFFVPAIMSQIENIVLNFKPRGRD